MNVLKWQNIMYFFFLKREHNFGNIINSNTKKLVSIDLWCLGLWNKNYNMPWIRPYCQRSQIYIIWGHKFSHSLHIFK